MYPLRVDTRGSDANIECLQSNIESESYLESESYIFKGAPIILRVSEFSITRENHTYRTLFLVGNNETNNPLIKWKRMKGGVWVVELSAFLPINGTKSTFKCPSTIYEYFSEPIGNISHDGCMSYNFKVIVENNIQEEVLLHWHGLTPPVGQDGVPWVTAPPIAPGKSIYYDFVQLAYPGAYFIHSHYSIQLAFGPLLQKIDINFTLTPLGLAVPAFLQHTETYLNSLGDPVDVVALLEERFLYPYCAYSGHYLYKENCSHIDASLWAQGFWFLNRKEDATIVDLSPGRPVRLRIINAGTEAPWNFTINSNTTMIKDFEILAVDGVDVKRGVRRRHMSIGTANRFDVLIRVPRNDCMIHILEFYQMLHRGRVNDPAARYIFLKVCSENCTSCPNYHNLVNHDRKSTTEHSIGFNNEYYDLINELDSVYPLKYDPSFANKTYEISIEGGDQFGGFPLTLRDEHHNLLRPEVPLRKRKWAIHPIIQYYNNRTGDKIVTRRECLDCEHGHYSTSGLVSMTNGKGKCCWEWCSKFNSSPEEKDVKTCNNCIRNAECKRYVRRHITFPQGDELPRDPIEVCLGWRVHLWVNNTKSFEGKEGHPMHLHGHKFEVLEIQRFDEKRTKSKSTKMVGLLMDTIWIPWNSQVKIRFDAWRPGRWLFHCHNEFHLENGMATAVVYVEHGKNVNCERTLLHQKFTGDRGAFPLQLCGMAGCKGPYRKPSRSPSPDTCESTVMKTCKSNCSKDPGVLKNQPAYCRRNEPMTGWDCGYAAGGYIPQDADCCYENCG